jgi:6-phosphogluconolactonase
MLKDNWLIFNNIDALSKRLADDILNIANYSIKSKNKFTIVLAGGTSFINVYRILCNSESNWEKWHIFIGDERCLEANSSGRNDFMINKIWLKNGLIPVDNINFIPTELGVELGALHYEKIINKVNKFDLVLLGMGEDGHTASLFPGHSYTLDRDVIPERNSPEYPKYRVSLSYEALNRSTNVFKVIGSSNKKHAVDLWIKGVDLPINRIHGKFERVYACNDSLTL